MKMLDSILVFEESGPSFYEQPISKMKVGYNGSEALRVSYARWKHVKAFHIIYPPEQAAARHLESDHVFQLYTVKNATGAHYQVSGEDKSEYLSKLERFSRDKDIEINHYDSITAFHVNDFVCIVNPSGFCSDNDGDKLRRLCEFFDPDKVRSILNTYENPKNPSGHDDTRGNQYLDRHFSGSANQRRSKQFGGLATPVKRAVNSKTNKNETMSAEDTAYLDQCEQLLFDAAKENLPLSCNPEDKDKFMIQGSDAILDILGGKPSYHQTRLAMTSSTHVVGPHTDNQNGNSNATVSCVSCYDGSGERFSLIGYGRSSVENAASKIDRYLQTLQDILKFYTENASEINAEFVASVVPAEGNDVCRFVVALNKLVYYAIFIDRMLILTDKFALCPRQRIAMLYSTLLSNSPDAFVAASKDWELEYKSWTGITDVFELARYFYQSVTSKKDCNQELFTSAQARNKARMQPTVGKGASDEQIARSVSCMIDAHEASLNIADVDSGDASFFYKTVSNFAASKGVHHAGPLLSQHLVVMGACIGVFPLEWATMGHICNDNDRITDYFYENYKLFDESVDFAEEGLMLLEALSFSTNQSMMVCENVTCKFVQDSLQTAGKWSDSFFADQRGVYLPKNVTRKNGKSYLSLILVTKSNEMECPVPPSKNYGPVVRPTNKVKVYNDFFSRRGAFKKPRARYRRRQSNLTNHQIFPSDFQVMITKRKVSNFMKLLASQHGQTCLPVFKKPVGNRLLPNGTYQRVKKKPKISNENLQLMYNRIGPGKKWVRCYLLFRSSTSKKPWSPDDRDVKTLLPAGYDSADRLESKDSGEIYFRNLEVAREYTVVNYLLKTYKTKMYEEFKSSEVTSGDTFLDVDTVGNYFDKMTVIHSTNRHGSERGRPKGIDKAKKFPHYVYLEWGDGDCAVYSCDEKGNVDKSRRSYLLRKKPTTAQKKNRTTGN